MAALDRDSYDVILVVNDRSSRLTSIDQSQASSNLARGAFSSVPRPHGRVKKNCANFLDCQMVLNHCVNRLNFD